LGAIDHQTQAIMQQAESDPSEKLLVEQINRQTMLLGNTRVCWITYTLCWTPGLRAVRLGNYNGLKVSTRKNMAQTTRPQEW